MIEPAKKEAIAREVLRVIETYSAKFPDESSTGRNAPIHEAILHAYHDQLKDLHFDVNTLLIFSSWVQGINTSLGTFYEKTGHILSGGIKRPFTKKRGTPLKVMESQVAVIDNIISELKSGAELPNIQREMELIKNAESSDMKDAKDFTVDVFIEKPEQIIAVEMKSVRPNKGESYGEKDKILEAKAALMNEFPDKEIVFIVGFPFDPTSDVPTGYDKNRFMSHLIGTSNYFAEDEFMIASELWDFLSSHSNTMEEIIEIILQVVKNFLDKKLS